MSWLTLTVSSWAPSRITISRFSCDRMWLVARNLAGKPNSLVSFCSTSNFRFLPISIYKNTVNSNAINKYCCWEAIVKCTCVYWSLHLLWDCHSPSKPPNNLSNTFDSCSNEQMAIERIHLPCVNHSPLGTAFVRLRPLNVWKNHGVVHFFHINCCCWALLYCHTVASTECVYGSIYKWIWMLMRNDVHTLS